MLMAILADFLQENIWQSLTEKPVLLPVAIYIYISLIKQIFRKIHFTSPVSVIDPSSIKRVFLPSLLFQVVWYINILIILLFSPRVTCLSIKVLAAIRCLQVMRMSVIWYNFLFVTVAPVHDIQRKMVFAKTHKIHLLEAICRSQKAVVCSGQFRFF